jgi:hypothetical protein
MKRNRGDIVRIDCNAREWTKAYSDRLKGIKVGQSRSLQLVFTIINSQVLYISSSAMSGLPAGPYYIYANIPTAGHKLVGATIHSNETTLVALMERQRAVS